MHSKDITHLHGGCCYDNYDKNLMIYESLMLSLNIKYYGTRSTLDLDFKLDELGWYMNEPCIKYKIHCETQVASKTLDLILT